MDPYRRSFAERLKNQPLRQVARIARFQARLISSRLNHFESRIAASHASGGSIHPVAEPLLPPSYEYQGYRGPWIEDFFLRHWLREGARTKLVYLPILWTNFYQFSQLQVFFPDQHAAIESDVDRILNEEIDPGKRYFTVLGYDHPIWNWHRFPRNVIVFSGGGWGDVPIPLLKGSPAFSCPPKDLRVSFVGRLDGASDATGVRTRMHHALRGMAHFSQGKNWRQVMARSTFSLCPRGLGRASFRLYEALGVGSIPIHIWDDANWLPYQDEIDWHKISISVHVDEVETLPSILEGYTPDRIASMQSNIAQLYESHFTLEGACRQIGTQVERLGDEPLFRECASRRPYPEGMTYVGRPL